MDWQVFSSIGTLITAVATLIAAAVALFVGTRPYKRQLFSRAYFLEIADYETIDNHPNCFIFECVNKGNCSIYVTHILEKAHFQRNPRGLKAFLISKIRSKRITMVGASIPDVSIPKYSHWYSVGSCVEISPGSVIRIETSFAVIEKVQRERKRVDLFDLDRRLKYYIVDITGKKHPVKSGAYPNSFLEERTCRLIKRRLFD